MQHALQAAEDDTIIYGVKGVSLSMLINNFDIIKSFPPEYMHCVLLGVVKTFISTWFDPQFRNDPYSLCKQKIIFDDRLLNILPPCEVTRTPQSINNLCRWKASEYKHFLTYYSLPVLKDLLPNNYYNHWWSLVYAITIYDKEHISVQEMQYAEKAIKQFVQKTEQLYGKQLMKYNVHLLLHIPECVKSFGALWAWSAFPYESYNFVLRQMIHNSQSLLNQICKSYLRFQIISQNKSFSSDTCNINGKNMYNKLLGKYKKTGRVAIAERNNFLSVYGKGEVIKLSLSEKLAIERVLGEEVNMSATKFLRFMFNKKIYHSHEYLRIFKRNNSIIESSFGTFIRISGLMSIKPLLGEVKHIILGKIFNVIDDILCLGSANTPPSTHIFKTVQLSNNIAAIKPESISTKCIIINCENKSYLARLVNKVELD